MIEKKNKKKRLTKKQKLKLKRQLYKNIIISIILIILVLSFAYLIFKTELLQPRVNTLTTSYISFNNSNTTDMLKIDNLSKMSYSKGISSSNKSSIDFNITGNNNSNYDIVIYPIINRIDYKYINYSLISNNKIISSGKLEDKDTTSDNSIVLYQSTINSNNSYTLRMWISKDYKLKVGSNSFEVKIKSR
jgi:cell division protein FtsL